MMMVMVMAIMVVTMVIIARGRLMPNIHLIEMILTWSVKSRFADWSRSMTPVSGSLNSRVTR